MAVKEDDVSGMSIKTLAGIVGAITVILSSAFFIDGRYVHAESFKENSTRQELTIERNSLEMRKYYIEDRIQSIEAKPKAQRTDADESNMSRYMRDRDDTDKRLRDIEKRK